MKEETSAVQGVFPPGTVSSFQTGSPTRAPKRILPLHLHVPPSLAHFTHFPNLGQTYELYPRVNPKVYLFPKFHDPIVLSENAICLP